MYVVKICKDKQILDVLHYEKFENIFADVANKSIFYDSCISNEILEEIDNCENLKLYSASETDDKVADDFEFRYGNGIYVYAGIVHTEDMSRYEDK